MYSPKAAETAYTTQAVGFMNPLLSLTLQSSKYFAVSSTEAAIKNEEMNAFNTITQRFPCMIATFPNSITLVGESPIPLYVSYCIINLLFKQRDNSPQSKFNYEYQYKSNNPTKHHLKC